MSNRKVMEGVFMDDEPDIKVPAKKSPDSALVKSRIQRILRNLMAGGVSYAEGADPHKGDPEKEE